MSKPSINASAPGLQRLGAGRVELAASDLGIAFEKLPMAFVTDLGNGQPFQLTGCEADGDRVTWRDYHQSGTDYYLRIYND